jgi:response regulator RpfG family c-di-GMP phosphodiesterase
MDLFLTERQTIVMVGLPAKNQLWIPSLLMDTYDVQLASSLEELWCTLSRPQHLPSLILLGAQLTASDRTEIIQQIKRNPDTWHIPLVLFGGLKNEADELLGYQQGVADVIALPMRTDLLKAKIRARLAQSTDGYLTRLICAQLESTVDRKTDELRRLQASFTSILGEFKVIANRFTETEKGREHTI